MPLNKQDICWVSDAAHLQDCCDRWQQLPSIAIDTEFMRTNTYYPVPALIQVNDGQANYLLDPLAGIDLEPFSEVLANTALEKVLHACSEDLEVFHHLFGLVPSNVFDTQIAASFCGLNFSMGYAALASALLDIEVPKGETRSDWLRRPLSSAQIDYAALDVELLFQMAPMLKAKLHDRPHYAWVMEECDTVLSNCLQSQDPDRAILRFKHAWKLSPSGQYLLSELSRWRELEAQKRNMPRNFVMREQVLILLAETQPLSFTQLRQVEGLSEKSSKIYGEDIIDIVKHVQRNGVSQPIMAAPQPLNALQKKQVKDIKARLVSLTEEMQVVPEYLAKKKEIEYIVRANSQGETEDALVPESFSGWRKKEILPKLMEVL